MSQPTAARGAVYAIVSTVLSLGVAEGVVRWADHGALPQIDCYEPLPAVSSGGSTAPATIRLQPGCHRTLGRPDGGAWTLDVDVDGVRAPVAGPPSPRPWLVVGDSQVLGMNVDVADTAVARLTAAGVPARGVGVPGHGVEDALGFAERLLRRDERGVIVVVNGANDWTEVGLPVTGRYAVAGGWLVPPDRRDTVAGRFFASPLSASHLLTYGVVLAAHDWSQDPAEKRWTDSPWGLPPAARATASARIGAAIAAFHAAHPALDLRVVLLPVDFSTSEARAGVVLAAPHLADAPWRDPSPWAALAAALPPVPYLDLGPLLEQSADFLDGDYHLSPQGHGKMAVAVADWLAAEPPP